MGVAGRGRRRGAFKIVDPPLHRLEEIVVVFLGRLHPSALRLVLPQEGLRRKARLLEQG